MSDKRDRLAGSLSHGQKQWLEIGMLLAQEPKLLLVDEPVAGMTDAETAETAILLKEIAKTRSVVVVEHDMGFIRDLGVKVTCLAEGSVLAEARSISSRAIPRSSKTIWGGEGDALRCFDVRGSGRGGERGGCAAATGGGQTRSTRQDPLCLPAEARPARSTGACKRPVVARPRSIPFLPTGAPC